MSAQKLTRIANTQMLPALPPWLAFTQGRLIHVKPYSGDDSRGGWSPDNAVKTLTRALALATADKNDIVLLYAESNSAASTTDYQTTTLVWSKDGVHLIGVCAGGPYNKRARIAWASTASSSSDIPLVTVSADNCYIANISIAVGVADANLSFGLNVTGDNNFFENVDVAFPINATNDAAGAYAVKLDGCDQTRFKGCTFGSFTIDMGSAANQLLLVDSGCSMVTFEDCDFIQRIESTTNSPAVRLADAASVGFGCLWFKRCNFISTAVSGAYAQAGAFKTTATQNDGRIVLADCHTNAGKWDVDDADMILNGCVGVPIDDNAGEVLAV